MNKNCRICKKLIIGRTDKVFCSDRCKSYYHRKLREVTSEKTSGIDEFLHRNRSILLEFLGKSKVQVKIKRILLDKKNFKFKYHTHFNINSRGKTYFHVYDIAWMEFSDNEILIVRRS